MVEPKYYNTAGHPRIGSTTSAPENNLSPTAQAVLDASFSWYDCEALYSFSGEQHAGMIAAAALRAAIEAGRRGPEHWEGSRPDDFDKGWDEALDWMAWVAAELEDSN